MKKIYKRITDLHMQLIASNKFLWLRDWAYYKFEIEIMVVSRIGTTFIYSSAKHFLELTWQACLVINAVFSSTFS